MTKPTRRIQCDATFSEQLVAYLEEQASLTTEQRQHDDETMAVAEQVYATMPSVALPDSLDPTTLDAFFTPEIMGRLLVCPKINVDLLDDWGMCGTEPGFMLVKSMRYEGTRSLNDQLWLQGRSIRLVPNLAVPVIASWDSFPRLKFSVEIITASRHPAVFEFLVSKVCMAALPAK